MLELYRYWDTAVEASCFTWLSVCLEFVLDKNWTMLVMVAYGVMRRHWRPVQICWGENTGVSLWWHEFQPYGNQYNREIALGYVTYDGRGAMEGKYYCAFLNSVPVLTENQSVPQKRSRWISLDTIGSYAVSSNSNVTGVRSSKLFSSNVLVCRRLKKLAWALGHSSGEPQRHAGRWTDRAAQTYDDSRRPGGNGNCGWPAPQPRTTKSQQRSLQRGDVQTVPDQLVRSLRHQACDGVCEVCLPLLISSPCNIKSRCSLLALAHPGGPEKRAVKRLWLWWW